MPLIVLDSIAPHCREEVENVVLRNAINVAHNMPYSFTKQ